MQRHHRSDPLPDGPRPVFLPAFADPGMFLVAIPGAFTPWQAPESWPSGRRRTPAKGVWVKSPSRVRIPLSPPVSSDALPRASDETGRERDLEPEPEGSTKIAGSNFERLIVR